MFYTKYPHPANFSFAVSYDSATHQLAVGNRLIGLHMESFHDEVHRFQFTCEELWQSPRRIIQLNTPINGAPGSVTVTPGALVSIADSSGQAILKSAEGQSFGVSGESWMMVFDVEPETEYYGMGEKTYGRLELSGVRTKFWNTDVWGDFHFGQWKEFATDPPYLSVPYLILRTKHGFTGIFVNSSHPVFMETPGRDDQRVFVEWQRTNPRLVIGAESGQPEIWVIHGPDLKSLTRKFQKFVGTTPLPPLWALGYHQSRWGYAGEEDLRRLDAEFDEHEIPCSGLWLDIDYMDGYRVFSFDKSHFPNGTRTPLLGLQEKGRRIVAILDPGVKFERSFAVFESGIKEDVFCRGLEGKPFVGLVWPGETVFPDFTMESARTWWSKHVQCLCDEGFSAFWVDMNDPSTGPVDPTGMLFNRGTESHASQRNDYALGMQMATRDGLLAARPNERPFILSRSGSAGTSRFSAIWTGDNVSNDFYLRLTVPTTLNLSLSGIPFNGPDIGGFGDDTNEALMVAWMKACFLFPFTRNHTGFGTRNQEPWTFSENANVILAHYIRLRYRLLPYLYQLYIQQEESGDPILRPLFYEFESATEGLDDQFLVGPAILHAPILSSKSRKRTVHLPGNEPWFDARDGTWVNRSAKIKQTVEETPLYIRNGALIPMAAQADLCKAIDLKNVAFHFFAAPESSGETDIFYHADDGLTFDYQSGKRSAVKATAQWTRESVSFTAEVVDDGFGDIEIAFVTYDRRSVAVNGVESIGRSAPIQLSGSRLSTSIHDGEPHPTTSSVRSKLEFTTA